MILLLYTLSISSPLLTSLQQLLIALWLLPRCLNAFYTPFLRSFLPSKTLAPSSPIWASSWRWLQLSHFSRVWLFATPWTVGSSQAPRSMGFSGKNTGEGCQALFQGIFLTWGSNLYLLLLLHWQAGFFFFLALMPSGRPMTAEVIPNPLFQGLFMSDQFLTFIEMTDARFWCASLEAIGDFVTWSHTQVSVFLKQVLGLLILPSFSVCSGCHLIQGDTPFA